MKVGERVRGWCAAIVSVRPFFFSFCVALSPASPVFPRLPTNPSGRTLAVELPRFWLATVYVPNSGEGLRRLGFRTSPGGWDEALAAWVADLSASAGGKPVLLCGDLNCAREPVDIYAPATHTRSAGFTPEERASFAERLLGGAGLVDCLRSRVPADQPAYTYWSYRAGNRPKNRGWRLDYFLAPAAFDAEDVADAWQLPHVRGSDHCPVGLAVKGGAGE
jgi:exodeoxyribonuclease III